MYERNADLQFRRSTTCALFLHGYLHLSIQPFHHTYFHVDSFEVSGKTLIVERLCLFHLLAIK